MRGLSSRRGVQVLMVGIALASIGQSGASAQSRVYRSRVELVPLTVTVTNRTGEYVRGLTRNDFTVLEDGVPQALAFFAAGTVPIDVALVLDASASMTPQMPLVRTAARGLIRTLRDGDRGAVVSVGRSVAMPQGFTGSREAIEAAVDAVPPRGTTALYNGLYIALKELARERRGQTEVRRQVLIVLSDGFDNASHVTAEDVADTARHVGASIYVVALTAERDPFPGSERDRLRARAAFEMQALAADSGGRLFQATSARELPAIYQTIADELASQYDLGYLPSGDTPTSGFRRVAVRISAATKAVARTRSGYYAGPEAATGRRSDGAAMP